MGKPDQATKILMAFDECSNSMEGLLYLPSEKVGEIVEAALSMRREIAKLEQEVSRLKEQIKI